MPELPEVETICRGLQARLPGNKIKSIEVRAPKLFKGVAKTIIDIPITTVRRIAKVLVIDFANDQSLIIHLKMTGQLVYVKDGQAAAGGHPERVYEQPLPHKHTHLIYYFVDGAKLYYNDLRKFGWHKIVKTDQVIATLGPALGGVDILSPNFTLNYFQQFLALRSKRPIKEAILEQRYLTGLGNIYAAEALWRAKIRPDRSAATLSAKEQSNLYRAIVEIIDLSIQEGGSSFNSYINVEGQQGSFLRHAQVYKKEFDSLGHKIERLKQGGRTTHFCPICQR